MSAPLTSAESDSGPYFEGLSRGVIRLQRCRSCGHFQFPPRAICTNCMSRDLGWETASGKGRVYAYTVIHRAPEERFERLLPYGVALVDLVEGVRVLARAVVPPQEVITGCEVVIQPEVDPEFSDSLVFIPK